MRWPIKNFWISQSFHGINKDFNYEHWGTDLATVNNSATEPMLAPESGVITHAYKTWSKGGYFGGNYIKMRGDSGFSYYLGHAKSVHINAGDRVSEGQEIGIVGQTGQASGNHIHFEMYDKSGKAVDAERIIIEKEEEVKITENQVLWHYRTILGYDPSDAELKAYVGQDYFAATEDMKKYAVDNGKAFYQFKKTAVKPVVTKNEAEKQLADLREALKPIIGLN